MENAPYGSVSGGTAAPTVAVGLDPGAAEPVAGVARLSIFPLLHSFLLCCLDDADSARRCLCARLFPHCSTLFCSAVLMADLVVACQPHQGCLQVPLAHIFILKC
ncbi:hypothetical protein PoB_004375200 [Plakobranchus ocellatus]|uniref:Uncharacterized protein n=1 Tax=Plakobranchus ocellatus TaxID=259542 RepID=A0AAV4BDI2_9GAST|nr:hypothetical protein PoB_004375200 [Plakobranchus ocellatus]